MAIVFLYGTIIGFLIATSGTQMVIYLCYFIPKLVKQIDFPTPNIAPEKLRLLTNGILKTVLSWYGGAAIAAVAVFKYMTAYVVIYLILFFLVGLAGFLVPQYFFHTSIKHSRERLLGSLAIHYDTSFRQILYFATTNTMNEQQREFQRAHFLGSIYEDVRSAKTWAFNFVSIIKLFAYSLVPVASALLRVWISARLGAP